MNLFKQKNAITLIALVITIVVLIILATVAINLSLGDNGIFSKAKTAKEQYQNAQNDEEIKIAQYSNTIDKYVDGTRENEDNYSLQEKLIGKWVNGENLYQRTFVLNNLSSGSNTILTDWNSDYTIQDISGLAVETSGEIWCVTPGNPSWCGRLEINNDNLVYVTSGLLARVNLTIKYTK